MTSVHCNLDAGKRSTRLYMSPDEPGSPTIAWSNIHVQGRGRREGPQRVNNLFVWARQPNSRHWRKGALPVEEIGKSARHISHCCWMERTALLGTHPDHVEIVIADDGCGMTPEVKRRAFDPFFTTGRHRGARGLGLHTVYNIVAERLGGHVKLDSESGTGTTVQLILPRSAPRAD